MYLKKISANKQSFHDLIFEPNVLNVILGTKGKEVKNKTNTVNGVGKTLSIKLIDYCLGCRSDAHKEIKKLKGWEFKLEFFSNDNKHEIIRAIPDDNFVYYDGNKIKLSDMKQILECDCYNHVEEYKYVTFRGLICRNLRIPKDAYLEWRKYKKGEDEYKSLLLNAYLLGLDVSYILNKIDIKEKINKIDTNKKLLENNTDIKEAMSGSDIHIELSNLQKEIEELQFKIDNFKISEGYNEIKSNTQEYINQKNEIINQISKYKNIIDSINKNINLKVDITAQKVIEIYNEANVIFSNEFTKNLEQISDFHEKLLTQRKTRLIKDKKDYVKTVNKLKKQLAEKDELINKNMDFIRDKVSNSEYEKLQGRLTELKVMAGKMKQYKAAVELLQIKKAKYQADMAENNIKAFEYINSIEEKKSFISSKFSTYVDYIYDERKFSGIDIVNNSGDNKIRFDINVRLQDEDSGGVGNVKIFCMDLLLWELGINNNIDFLYHDGSLFAETDPRQCYKMIKLASDICEKKRKQYIVNMNYDMYESIIQVAIDSEDTIFVDKLNKAIRLKLYDTCPEEKLLGVEIK